MQAVTFLVDLALPGSVQGARTKSPKTAFEPRRQLCPSGASRLQHRPFSCTLSGVACLHFSVCIFLILSHHRRLIGTQHAFAIEVAVARLRSVAQSRSVLQLTIQIQIPVPIATSLSVPRHSISSTSPKWPC